MGIVNVTKSYLHCLEYKYNPKVFIMWKSRGAGRYEGRDAGVSASFGDSTGSSFCTFLVNGVEL